MKRNIKVGIPSTLLYYKYKNLWDKFFCELNIDIVYSNNSNIETLRNGCLKVVDESCLALKIFMGHVMELENKCDYILIPRLASIKKDEQVCTYFMALYDLCNNIFDCNILKFNIDVDNNIDESDAFIDIGKTLGIDKIRSLKAYVVAKKHDDEIKKRQIIKQNFSLKENNLKILLVGHSYNLHDALIGKDISDYLINNNINIIYSDIYNKVNIDYEFSFISKTCYWTFNKELMGALIHYKDLVDGIILISSFPCGPDSLTNEMIVRNTDKPIITLIMDEFRNQSGVITRLESFIDVIKERRLVASHE